MKIKNTKKINIKEKKLTVVVVIAVLILVMISVSIYLLADSRENRTVAKVNGAAVSDKEFKMFLMDNVANTYNYFKQKYNVDDSANFWSSTYGEEIPIEYARQKAMEQLTRAKIEQLLASEKGLMQDITYTGFQKSLNAENKRRKEYLSQGRVIYGPNQYQSLEYFRYVHSNIQAKLQEKLGEKELAISDEEVEKYYTANKETGFKRNDDVKVQIIAGMALTEEGVSSVERKDEVRAKLQKIKTRLDKGELLEEIVKTDGTDAKIKIDMQEKKFTDENSRTDNQEYPVVIREAKKLSLGQTSSIFEEDEYLVLLKCIERKDMGYRELEDIQETVRTILRDKKYEEMIDILVKQAKVEIVQSLYQKMSVR